MPRSEKDLYKILGVAENASAADVKKAYRDLAKRNHPDRTGGDKTKEQRFKEITAAYEVLSDPKKREQYDLMRRGGGMPDMSQFSGIDGIEELFASMFGGMNMGGGRGQAGRVVFESRPFTGFGGGGGPGRGMFDFGGAPFGGAQAATAAPPTEEVIRTRDGHEVVRRGNDVYSDLEVSIQEAVLGTKADVATLDGRVTVTLPAGTSSGKKLRLRGKGPGGRGDHYVTVKIVVPEKVDARAEELIREFAKRAPVRVKR
jgi:DnaJ-class molecular chaperone